MADVYDRINSELYSSDYSGLLPNVYIAFCIGGESFSPPFVAAFAGGGLRGWLNMTPSLPLPTGSWLGLPRTLSN
jgi:hypothetical protein